LHKPKWEEIRHNFLSTLIRVYQQSSARNGTLYVSLLDVRDEVSRQLKLSSLSFEDFLDRVMVELPSEDFPWSTALETDVREEQSKGAGLERRQVYYRNVPHSLIAMARLG
jgi:hypothetical protein